MKNKTVVIVGGSAGALISGEIFANQYTKILFLETYAEIKDKKKILGSKIIEGLDFLKKRDVDYFIATGDNKQREENYQLIFKTTGKNPVNCIHKTAFISKSAKIGYGNLIGPFALIHTEAVVGNNTIINSGAIVEHSSIVEDYAQISPQATLCGYVTVGRGAFVGAGSTVIPKINLAEGCIIAAGSSVIKDVQKNTLVAGVPAVVKKKL